VYDDRLLVCDGAVSSEEYDGGGEKGRDSVGDGTSREFLLLLLLFDFVLEPNISAANSEKDERALRDRCVVVVDVG
jgi:hypothetical protein